MPVSTDERIARLSPRQRECLRLVYHRKKTGQIASSLGLSMGTVNGYIADAVRAIGARDRVDAAEQLVAWEGVRATPEEMQGHSLGVEPEAPASSSTGDGSEVPWWRPLVPFRLKGSPGNELGIFVRILWIPLIALAFVGGFGVLADALRIVSDVIGGRVP